MNKTRANYGVLRASDERRALGRLTTDRAVTRSIAYRPGHGPRGHLHPEGNDESGSQADRPVPVRAVQSVTTVFPEPHSHVRVRATCDQGHMHDVCVRVPRTAPPALRWDPTWAIVSPIEDDGTCHLPDELDVSVWRIMRDYPRECRELGFVRVPWR